jgi:hypothetical protein
MAITESDEIKVAMFRPRAVKLKMPDRIRKPSTLRCFQLPFSQEPSRCDFVCTP